MQLKLKPLSEQNTVITGAPSGISLSTATIAVAGGVALAAWLGSKVSSSTGLRAS